MVKPVLDLLAAAGWIGKLGSSQSESAIPGLLARRVDTGSASLSGQAVGKTTIAPAAVLHAPQATVQSVGVFSGELFFQVPCQCGFRAGWEKDETFAQATQARHAERHS